jgi:hypothetical protein
LAKLPCYSGHKQRDEKRPSPKWQTSLLPIAAGTALIPLEGRCQGEEDYDDQDFPSEEEARKVRKSGYKLHHEKDCPNVGMVVIDER